jgi:two-component system, OmpR family, phosphate regulon response regulator PhoB
MEKLIYVLEDNTDIGEMVQYLLNSQGFKTRHFVTALQFWESMNNLCPDLVVLDVMLPDGNGIEISKILKSDPQFSHIPILLMSAFIDVPDISQSAAEEFIQKPFDIIDFGSVVKRLIA